MTADLTPDNDRPDWTPPDGDTPPLEGPSVEPDGIEPDGFAEVVSESQIRTLLAAAGGMTHYLIGHPDIAEHWSFTVDELDSLTPAFATMVNRSARLRAIVHRGDALALAVTLARYADRNLKLSRQIADLESETPPEVAEEGSEIEIIPKRPEDLQPWDEMP